MLVACSQEIEVQEVHSEEVKTFVNEYHEFHQINHDYVGKLSFESGLIDLPVLQSDNYEEYLRRDWISGEYDIGGSVFIDPYADINSQNITLYGHNYDSGDKMFTPLHKLKDRANYKANRYLNFVLKDEVRRYVIAHVFYVEIKETDGYQYLDEINYMQSAYEEENLKNYLKKLKDIEFYHTGVKINTDDRFLTMQTCVSGRSDLRLIVIAKEIEKIKLR